MSEELQVILAVLLILVSYVFYLYWGIFRARKKLNWLPQAPGWPLIGGILEFGGHTETLNDIWRLTNNPEKTSHIQIANQSHILTRNYNLIEFVLSSPHILDKSPDYKYLSKWLGTGLLISTGLKWKKRRKVITPAFHFSILEQFVDIFNSNVNVLIKKLNTEAVDKASVDIYSYVTACALDIICETAMGVNIETQQNKNQDYVFAVKDICRIALTRAFSIWRGSDILFRFSDDYAKFNKHLDILHGLTNSVIDRKKKELQKVTQNVANSSDPFIKRKRLAFLDLLLTATIDGQPLSKEDIREEVDTFMFEGHDTTSSASASTLFFLANYPEVQKKAREEQDRIFVSNDNTPTYQDLQDMKYLDMVIKESIRLVPPVPLFARQFSKDTIYRGHCIPKDTIITISAHGINRDADFYKNPDEFQPERFLDVRGDNPYAFIPFSAGPRNCIGQKYAMLEIKSIVSGILRNFELLTTDPPHEWLLSNEAILKSINGVKIRVKKYDG